jgi:hypothetical protein
MPIFLPYLPAFEKISLRYALWKTAAQYGKLEI